MLTDLLAQRIEPRRPGFDREIGCDTDSRGDFTRDQLGAGQRECNPDREYGRFLELADFTHFTVRFAAFVQASRR